MANRPHIWRVSALEDSASVLMARILNRNGDYAVRSDIESIDSYLRRLDTPGPISHVALTVDDVMFDTLQTSRFWDVDRIGYNFLWRIPSSVFSSGGKRYGIDIRFSTSEGDVFYVPVEVSVTKRLTS